MLSFLRAGEPPLSLSFFVMQCFDGHSIAFGRRNHRARIPVCQLFASTHAPPMTFYRVKEKAGRRLRIGFSIGSFIPQNHVSKNIDNLSVKWFSEPVFRLIHLSYKKVCRFLPTCFTGLWRNGDGRVESTTQNRIHKSHNFSIWTDWPCLSRCAYGSPRTEASRSTTEGRAGDRPREQDCVCVSL
jgi:hypothetical protein